MTIEQRIEEHSDQFPVGMRVLAVDDDPTCLLLLERLLRRCKYHVTTRTHAVAALNLLRENRNRFDLVISDVHMPDMDGFKLLELVGLEMDLPVIMLSANGDPKLVMKGITHGACDYLLKPVRIEELQIIWQHVIRKKKVEPKDQKVSENGHNGSNEGGQGGNGNADQKSSKKRKDQVDDEDEDHDENGLENDDPSAQKKPRVVWSIELHRKFVAAVNHLGVDKAVPKRILELMNVEKLTRENVASHLQKYRLYLRRISCVQSQQANMVAAFGNTDPASYMRISSLNGMGGFSQLSGSPQFQDAAFRSFQPNGMLGRLNSPANLGIQRLPSTVQVNHSQFSGFSGHAADQGATLLPGNLSGCILHENNSHRSVGDVPTKVDDVSLFSVSTGLPDAKPIIGSLNSCHFASINNPLMLQGHPVQAPSRVGIRNQSSATLASITTGPDLSSHFSDRARGNDNLAVSVQSSVVRSNPYATYSGGQQMASHLDEGCSISDLPLSVTDYQYQGGQSSINFGHDRKQSWGNFPAAPIHVISDPVNSSNLCYEVVSPYGQGSNPNAQGMNAVDYPSMQHSEASSNIKREYQIGQGVPNNVGCLEDLVSSMMK
ncbi:hypothetical protein QQ045_024319 [Rhodiola kirilowii]